MATRRGRIYYIDRQLTTIGRLNRSLMTSDRDTALRREQMVLRLDDRGASDTLAALRSGAFTIVDLERAYERGPAAVRRLTELSGDPLLVEVVAEFERARGREIKSVARYSHSLRQFARWAPQGARLSHVARASVINEFRRHRLGSGLSPATVARDLAAVRQLIRWKLGKRLARSVFDEVASLKRPAKRTRRLSPAEIGRLMRAVRQAGVRQHYEDAFRLLLLTGLRPAELCALLVSDVDLEGGRLMVRDSKTVSGVREVPLIGPARVVVERRGREAVGGRLFPVGPERLSAVFRRIARLAGLEDVRLYDLRRTHAQYLRLVARDLIVVRDQLGHATVSEGESYTGRSQAEERRPFVERLAEIMGLAQEQVENREEGP